MKKFPLCAECYLAGYCRRLTTKAVTRDELTPAFIRDVRRMMAAKNLTRDQWLPYLDATYRDYPGRIVNAKDVEVRLNMRLFDTESIAYWFRDLCQPIPNGVTPRLRREVTSRFIVLASILKAAHPVATLLWGQEIANDNPPSDFEACPSSSEDECRYRHFTKLPVIAKSDSPATFH